MNTNEEFVTDRLIGKLVADGGEVPGRTGIPVGTVLYKVRWEDFSPETATWQTEDDIPCVFRAARSARPKRRWPRRRRRWPRRRRPWR